VYTTGPNRLFFQSNILVGQQVEIEIISPDLSKSERANMIYLYDGLYYFDTDFRYTGSYAMRVFKDDNKVGHSILSVGNRGGIVVKVPNPGA